MKPWVKILIGLILGILVGLVMAFLESKEISIGKTNEVFRVAGRVFIDLLRMLVGLIIFSSLVSGICHIHDPKKLGRIGFRTLIFYGVTTVTAILFGLIFVGIFKPGSGLSLKVPEAFSLIEANHFSFSEFILSIVPANPFASFAEGRVLQIIVFAVFFAYAIILAGERGKIVLNFLEAIAEVMYALAHFIMKLAPYGVFALIATAVTSIGVKIVLPLLILLLCNYLACILQVFIVFGLSLRYLARLEIIPFFKGMKDAIVLAFTTSSSSATLPVSLECVRDHLGVSKDISGFVMSLGSTINMNGAAIGQAISAVFIAQAYGIELGIIKIVILIFISLISAIGAAGIPGTGIVMLSVVLNAMGLPLEGIALIAGVDRLREMVSSVVNILGDAVAAVYVAKKEGQIDEKQYHAVTWLE